MQTAADGSVKPVADDVAKPPADPESARNLKPDTKAIESFTGLVFSPDGGRLYMSNVHGSVKVFAVEGRTVGDYEVGFGQEAGRKRLEGDLRTPLGVYFITSNLDPKSLKDFYGAGALPINYPNPYDARRGKTTKHNGLESLMADLHADD